MAKQNWTPTGQRKCAKCHHLVDRLVYVYPDPDNLDGRSGTLVCADRCGPALSERLVQQGIIIPVGGRAPSAPSGGKHAKGKEGKETRRPKVGRA
jgi:hypothetical protein